ncbi:RDD family protein [Cellulomonas fengjieae]|uniref:RDD family protein n=1 Tax=Cellulomonas fengjieae TaxID=2819978 RepID=UPI001AAEB1CE|nr:RDD family protein [Cellulomonas fengjieae]MBO3101742.1 RDD family protein [Cellulomonas fengjieae]
MGTAEHESLPGPTARRARTEPPAFAVAPWAVAPVGRRVGAFALDTLVALGAAGLGYAVAAALGPSGAPAVLPLALVLVVGVGQWIAEARTGATVGSVLTGIRTLSPETGRPAGLLRVLVRQLVVAAGTLAFGVGQWVVVASGAWDRGAAQRGWHDKAAGTLVLLAPFGRSAVVGRDSARALNLAVARAIEPGTSSAPTAMIRAVPGASSGEPAAPSHPAVITVDPGARPAGPPPAGPLIDAPAPAPSTRAVPPPALLAGPRPDLAGSPLVRPAGEDLRELERTRLRDTSRAGQARASGTRLRLRFDTGEVVDVRGDGLVGRHPVAETGTEHVVAIDDPERSISKVHLAFGLHADGRLWVMDRGSTNGTVVATPDGRTVVLRPGSRVDVAPGASVRFGGRSLQVTAH